MAESSVSGFSVAEESGAHHAIARVASNVAAFIGRTLKGPVNQPVSIRSFAEYTQIFGALWQPSTVSYAVEQFFENGGRVALVVRVVNGARPRASICARQSITTASRRQMPTGSTSCCNESGRLVPNKSKTRRFCAACRSCQMQRDSLPMR